MTNHPHRRQVRLSLTVAELDALVDVLKFANRQGYHPMTETARQNGGAEPTTSLVTKVYATLRGVVG